MKKGFLLIFLFLQITTGFTQEQHGLGALLMETSAYEALPKYQFTKQELTITDIDRYILNTPPPGDQGRMGSCVGWGVGYAFFSKYLFSDGSPCTWDANTIRSPSYIYNQIKLGDCNAGAYIIAGFGIICHQGACSIALMPYVDGDCSTVHKAPQGDDALNHRLRWWPSHNPDNTNRCTLLPYTINPRDIDQLKAVLHKNWPVVIGFKVNTSFDQMWAIDGIWKTYSGNVRGGHCAAIVGYDNIKKMFKVQNSWGTNGGDQGFFWVTYDLVQNGCFQEAYIPVR